MTTTTRYEYRTRTGKHSEIEDLLNAAVREGWEKDALLPAGWARYDPKLGLAEATVTLVFRRPLSLKPCQTTGCGQLVGIGVAFCSEHEFEEAGHDA